MSDQITLPPAEKHEGVSKPHECDACNYDTHTCHFCGAGLDHESYEAQGGGLYERHWLSDCRPDLVAHEPGPLCTWPDDPESNQYRDPGCYAYQDNDAPGRPWTKEHTHFYNDGPMA